MVNKKQGNDEYFTPINKLLVAASIPVLGLSAGMCTNALHNVLGTTDFGETTRQFVERTNTEQNEDYRDLMAKKMTPESYYKKTKERKDIAAQVISERNKKIKEVKDESTEIALTAMADAAIVPALFLPLLIGSRKENENKSGGKEL